VADYQPGDSLKEGIQISILLSVQQKMDHEIVFPSSGPNSTQQIMLSACGAKYTDTDFRLLLVKKLTEEVGKSQDHPNPRLVVRPSVGQKIFCYSRAITNTGERNLQPKCVAVCFLPPKKGRVYKCTRCDVGLFEVDCFCEISHQSKFVNYPLCEYCVL